MVQFVLLLLQETFTKIFHQIYQDCHPSNMAVDKEVVGLSNVPHNYTAVCVTRRLNEIIVYSVL